MDTQKFKLPKRIAELSKKPIETEVFLLEQEYMRLADIAHPTEFDNFLLDFCHKRCNKIWRKISRRA